ncbi:hypothetical protein U1Q18_000290 [Sarracenia purpurea var. burkii]
MEISAKLLKFKIHILFSIAVFLVIFSLAYLSPGVVEVFVYFWPLFVSTALFLIAVVLFAHTSPSATEAPCEKAGEGLLDFIAAQPEALQPAEEIPKSELNSLTL